MAVEIERKFLVSGEPWRAAASATRIRQGYLCGGARAVVRVRMAGERAFLTVKGEQRGVSRAEYEYEIPVGDAEEMLGRLCQPPLIEKTRYCLTHAGVSWVIDVFEGENAGLVVAEAEFSKEDQSFELPDWAGAEVTDQPRYLNVNLIAHPYRLWTAAERGETGGGPPRQRTGRP